MYRYWWWWLLRSKLKEPSDGSRLLHRLSAKQQVHGQISLAVKHVISVALIDWPHTVQGCQSVVCGPFVVLRWILCGPCLPFKDDILLACRLEVDADVFCTFNGETFYIIFRFNGKTDGNHFNKMSNIKYNINLWLRLIHLFLNFIVWSTTNHHWLLPNVDFCKILHKACLNMSSWFINRWK